MGSMVNNKFISAIGFFSHSERKAIHVIELTGGSGNFPKFISKYGSRTNKFKHCSMEHPVIILIDNDNGAKGSKGIFAIFK
jgi:hypothetical protein